MILFTIFSLLFYFHIWKDYSNSIKAIAEPMRDNVLKFKAKYKRYPTALDESLGLLELSGCDVTSASNRPRYEGEQRMVFTCRSIIKNMSVSAEVTEHATPYSLSFYRGYSRCHIRFDESNRTNIRCYQNPLIKHSP